MFPKISFDHCTVVPLVRFMIGLIICVPIVIICCFKSLHILLISIVASHVSRNCDYTLLLFPGQNTVSCARLMIS